jgi:hypothetical protein
VATVGEPHPDAPAGPLALLRVTWVSRAVPWLSLPVLVDGSERGRIRRRKVTMIELAPGPHSVDIRTGRLRSRPFEVDVVAGSTVDLYCGSRRSPHWMGGFEAWRWSRAHGLWLNDDVVAPPTYPPTIVRRVPLYRWVLVGLWILFLAVSAVRQRAQGRYGWMALSIAFGFASLGMLISWARLELRPQRGVSDGRDLTDPARR